MTSLFIILSTVCYQGWIFQVKGDVLGPDIGAVCIQSARLSESSATVKGETVYEILQPNQKVLLDLFYAPHYKEVNRPKPANQIPLDKLEPERQRKP